MFTLQRNKTENSHTWHVYICVTFGDLYGITVTLNLQFLFGDAPYVSAKSLSSERAHAS